MSPSRVTCHNRTSRQQIPFSRRGHTPPHSSGQSPPPPTLTAAGAGRSRGPLGLCFAEAVLISSASSITRAWEARGSESVFVAPDLWVTRASLCWLWNPQLGSAASWGIWVQPRALSAEGDSTARSARTLALWVMVRLLPGHNITVTRCRDDRGQHECDRQQNNQKTVRGSADG